MTNSPTIQAKASVAAPAYYARMPEGYQPIDVAERWITSAGDNVTPYQAALWFQIVKYAGRIFVKDTPASNLDKLAEYARRLRAAVTNSEDSP